MQTRNWLVAGWLVLASALAAAAQAPSAPPTTPAEPATTPEARMAMHGHRLFHHSQATAPAPAAAPAEEATDEGKEESKEEETGPTFAFGLRGEQKTIAPFTYGDAKTEEGKIEVTPEKNTLTVTLTGGVGANVWLGVHSEALQSFRLIQEFEVTCSDPSVRQMVLTLDSKLLGFVRSKHKASACVRLASLTVTPLGSASPILSVSHPLPCVGGSCHLCDPPMGSQSAEPLEGVKTQPMPLGVYVVDANFILTATAGGLLDAHSTAIFSPEPTELDPWEREHDPFKGEKKDGYGFTSVLTASTVGAPPVASEKTWKNLQKRLAKEKREKKLARQGVDPRLAARRVTR